MPLFVFETTLPDEKTHSFGVIAQTADEAVEIVRALSRATFLGEMVDQAIDKSRLN